MHGKIPSVVVFSHYFFLTNSCTGFGMYNPSPGPACSTDYTVSICSSDYSTRAINNISAGHPKPHASTGHNNRFYNV